MDLHYAADKGYSTPLSNSTLLPLLLLSLARQKISPDTKCSFKEEYDYIIVGAGAAGSVVASRLSEVPCVSVLLLEAGHAPPLLSDILTLSTSFWFTDLDWPYKTAPQKHTGLGAKNRQLNWHSGKALGGSTILNGGLYVRGNMKDYDNWAKMGATGWSYKDVLYYFKKMEDNKVYTYDYHHGVGGPITVSTPDYNPLLAKAISNAATNMGYIFVDPNGPRQTGFCVPQATLRDGQRCNSAKGYLVPAENRTNLDILPNAMVTKVIITDDVWNRRATGVTFDFKNQTYTVRAKREVIMSAGAINTAQLLILSGVGPLEELVKHRIPIKAVLPVGKNLQDHAGSSVEFLLSPNITTFGAKITDPKNIQRYIESRSGPLSSINGISRTAFLFDDVVNPVTDYPNYIMYFSEGSVEVKKLIYNLKQEVYQQVFAPYEGQPVLNCLVQQLHTRSRGSVTLRSRSAYDEPIIDPNYLADPTDVQDIVDGLKKCREIGRNHFLEVVGAKLFNTTYPGCETFADNEDNYFRCQVRSHVNSLSHQCGTAKMGDPIDPSTVVDPKLRVKGIKNLRVVDNSIMPTITSGNTAVPAMMIGEKASDLIKEDIQC